MSKKTLPAFEIGSGNIFADLGLPNAEEHLLKASLVVQLHRFIKARKLTQVAAAKLIGIKQPDLSNILRGHYQGFSLERLMRMLTAFDQDIEITVRPRRRKSKEGGRITFNPARLTAWTATSSPSASTRRAKSAWWIVLWRGCETRL